MHYLGGKHRLADKFAHIIQESIDAPGSTRRFVEPFVGGFNIVPHLSFSVGTCNDFHPGVISLYRALQAGWQPPRVLSRESYQALKARCDWNDPVTAFAAFGVSFSGREWGAYVESTEKDDVARRAADGLLRKARSMRGIEFTNKSYGDLQINPGDTVYCDPPYIGTTGYGKIVFNHEPFYEWAEAMAAKGARVFVSEFTAPYRPGWETLWEIERQVRVNNGSKAEGRAAKANIRTDRLMKVSA